MAAVVLSGSMNHAHFMPTCLAAAMKAPEPLATSPKEVVPLRPTALFLSGFAFLVFGGLKRQGRGGVARTARRNPRQQATGAKVEIDGRSMASTAVAAVKGWTPSTPALALGTPNYQPRSTTTTPSIKANWPLELKWISLTYMVCAGP
jgi:hypothetical protein